MDLWIFSPQFHWPLTFAADRLPQIAQLHLLQPFRSLNSLSEFLQDNYFVTDKSEAIIKKTLYAPSRNQIEMLKF